jgi:hypothetical protein
MFFGRGSRTATSLATLAALILVVVFGSPIFVDWVYHHTGPATAGGLFMRTLAWPPWSFASGGRDLLAQNVKAILLVVFTAVFLAVLAAAETARSNFAALLMGWSAFIFAGALAGFLAAFLSVHAGLYPGLVWAVGGAGYGLLTGWIVGLVQMRASR